MTSPLRRAKRQRNTKDAAGTVRIQILLVAAGTARHKKGNIVRSFHVTDAKVSDVAARIANLLGVA